MNKPEHPLSEIYATGRELDHRREPARDERAHEGMAPDYGDTLELDPIKLFWIAVHYRWIIATCMACGLVAGILVTWLQTPIYRAETKIEILTSNVKVLEEIETVARVTDLRTFETARTKILSRDLARRVVFELNLAEDSRFLAPTPTFSLMNIFRRAFSIDRTADLGAMTAQERQKRAVETVAGNLSATLLRNTSLIVITYDHPDPEMARRVVNQVAGSFIDQNVDKRGETSSLARDFIQEQVVEAKFRLEESERALVDYAEAEGITLDADESSLILTNISEINNRLTQALQDRNAAERLVAQIDAGQAATLPQVFESESIRTNKERIAELRATYQQNLATLKPGFPEMVRLRAQVGELENQMNVEIAAIASSVQLRYEQANANVASLRAELADLEGRQQEFQRKNIRYTILQREVDSNRAQYQSLINKLNEVVVGVDLQSANASIIDPAVRPDDAVSPRPIMNLGLALVLASLIAAVIVYILELLNNTFSVPDQIETELKLPVLGIVPKLAPDDLEAAMEDASSNYSEAHRTLRTSLQFTAAYEETKTLLVTSSAPAEGKTSLCYKLAHEYAALGRNVLIIDADMRRPQLHRMFKSDNTIGLSNVLTNIVRSTVENPVFRKSKTGNVRFLTSGTLPPNPADLLASERMSVLLHYCRDRYDLVIIDAPPVMGLSDAAILSRLADATLLVVSAKQVRRKAAEHAVKRLNAVGANIVGAVMTKFDIERLDYNYAYRYMSYDYYSYGADRAKLPRKA